MQGFISLDEGVIVSYFAFIGALSNDVIDVAFGGNASYRNSRVGGEEEARMDEAIVKVGV